MCYAGSMKMVEAITGMTRTYTFVFDADPEGSFIVTCPAPARTAAAIMPIRSACFSRLSTRSVCHRAASRWRIPLRRITPCRHSRKHTFQVSVNLLKLCGD
jgi:hypothetical protein